MPTTLNGAPAAPEASTIADTTTRPVRWTRAYAGKQPALQYLDMDAAIKHCTTGIGIWEWASTDRGVEPDVLTVRHCWRMSRTAAHSITR